MAQVVIMCETCENAPSTLREKYEDAWPNDLRRRSCDQNVPATVLRYIQCYYS